MANTYLLIGSVVVGAGGTTSMEFTSIPQTYTDLVLRLSTRMASQDYKVRFNGSTTDGLTRFLYGSGTSVAVFTNSGVSGYMGLTNDNATTASAFGNAEFYIPNYAVSGINKNVVGDSIAETNSSTSYMSLTTAIWSNTSAITSIAITEYGGGTIHQYSTAYLYGIKSS